MDDIQPALTQYQTIIAPYLNFGTTTYFCTNEKTGTSILTDMVAAMQPFLDSAASLDDCLSRLDAIADVVYREGNGQ